jgi:hypothetical protein
VSGSGGFDCATERYPCCSSLKTSSLIYLQGFLLRAHDVEQSAAGIIGIFGHRQRRTDTSDRPGRPRSKASLESQEGWACSSCQDRLDTKMAHALLHCFRCDVSPNVVHGKRWCLQRRAIGDLFSYYAGLGHVPGHRARTQKDDRSERASL